jgi:hypothetical protein
VRACVRACAELDAHSVYHLLADIEHPTLIIAGLLDLFTPAYQSYEIVRARMLPPGALRVLTCAPWAVQAAEELAPVRLRRLVACHAAGTRSAAHAHTSRLTPFRL